LVVQKHRRARARPGDGLELIYQRYATAKKAALANGTPALGTDYSEKEVELFHALISFSQKILFSANNNVLFAESIGLPPRIRADADFLIKGGADPDATEKSYVRVLQSIGNSIIVSLNELRENRQHVREMSDQDGVVRERQALAAALRPNPYEVLDRVIGAYAAELEASARQNPTRPGEAVADAIITAATKLRDSESAYVKASDAVRPLLEATETARAVRQSRADLLILFQAQVVPTRPNGDREKLVIPDGSDGPSLLERFNDVLDIEIEIAKSGRQSGAEVERIKRQRDTLNSEPVRGQIGMIGVADPVRLRDSATDVLSKLLRDADDALNSANAALHGPQEAADEARVQMKSSQNTLT
jgi:hypothetical protein